jgi:hypothetical protein
MATTETRSPDSVCHDARAERIARLLERPLVAAPGLVSPAGSRLRRVLETAPARRGKALFASRHAIVALVLYVAGALVIQQHAVLHMATQISGNIQGDPTQYMWAMWWWPHAIFSGINPFVTHDIWAPAAYNTGSITSTPTLALLFLPVNLILGWNQGPVVTYNLAQMLAPVLSAWFTYRLVLYLTTRYGKRNPAAAIAGGWLYGFGAYGLSQLQGHLQLVYTYIVPLLVLLAVRRFNDDISRRRLIVFAAIAIVAEIGIGTEVLFTGTCLLGVAWLAGLAFAPGAERRKLFGVGLELLGAFVVAAVITSPFLYYAATGPEVEQNSNSVLKMADLLGFIFPTPLIKAGAVRFAAVSNLFTEDGGVVENGVYLGIFLIGGGLAFMAGHWRRWGTKVLIVFTFVAFLWALGSTLTIAGQSTTWLPWRLLDHKAPFNEITPVRMGAWVGAGVCIAFALWLARPGRWVPVRWLVALIAAVMLWPNINGTYNTGYPVYSEGVASPPFITRGLYKKYLTPGEVIMPIPFGPFGNSLLWQAQARGYFRLASGWFGFIPPDYANSLVGQELMNFTPFTDPVKQMHAFIKTAHIGAFLVVPYSNDALLPDQSGSWPETFRALGLTAKSAGGVDVWDVPKSMRGTG